MRASLRLGQQIPLVTTPKNKYNAARSAFNFKPAKQNGPLLVHNPPQLSPHLKQTPKAFLPPNDPRRSLDARNTKSYTREEVDNMPLIHGYGNATYDITPKLVEEILTLRNQDPSTWTISKLARHFDVDKAKVNVITGSHKERQEVVEQALQHQQNTWHDHKRLAREDRRKRVQMWLRNEY